MPVPIRFIVGLAWFLPAATFAQCTKDLLVYVDASGSMMTPQPEGRDTPFVTMLTAIGSLQDARIVAPIDHLSIFRFGATVEPLFDGAGTENVRTAITKRSDISDKTDLAQVLVHVIDRAKAPASNQFVIIASDFIHDPDNEDSGAGSLPLVLISKWQTAWNGVAADFKGLLASNNAPRVVLLRMPTNGGDRTSFADGIVRDIRSASQHPGQVTVETLGKTLDIDGLRSVIRKSIVCPFQIRIRPGDRAGIYVAEVKNPNPETNIYPVKVSCYRDNQPFGEPQIAKLEVGPDQTVTRQFPFLEGPCSDGDHNSMVLLSATDPTGRELIVKAKTYWADIQRADVEIHKAPPFSRFVTGNEQVILGRILFQGHLGEIGRYEVKVSNGGAKTPITVEVYGSPSGTAEKPGELIWHQSVSQSRITSLASAQVTVELTAKTGSNLSFDPVSATANRSPRHPYAIFNVWLSVFTWFLTSGTLFYGFAAVPQMLGARSTQVDSYGISIAASLVVSVFFMLVTAPVSMNVYEWIPWRIVESFDLSRRWIPVFSWGLWTLAMLGAFGFISCLQRFHYKGKDPTRILLVAKRGWWFIVPCLVITFLLFLFSLYIRPFDKRPFDHAATSVVD